MCGRFSLSRSAEQLLSAFDLEVVPEWQPRYNIAPTQAIATLRAASSQRQFQTLRWGLIPSWAKDTTIAAKLINARAETVAEKPSFRAAFKQRRCLIPADGFYEWKRVNTKKQPHYFRLAEGEPFAFAGLWEHWAGETPIESCTIITTQANEVLQPVHDRMPVILSPQDYDRWLDPDTPPDALHALLHPYAQEMVGFPVSTLVNSPSNDRPECVNSL